MPAFVAGPRAVRTTGAVAVLVLAASVPVAIRALRSEPSRSPSGSVPVVDFGSAPATFVGITTRGNLVVGDSKTGRTLRILVGRGALGPTDRMRGLALSPDRATAYFVIHHDDDCSDVAAVPVAGGPIRILARGDSPTVAPDGKRLAYVDLLNCGGMRARVVVRDLASGEELSWLEQPGQPPTLAARAVWSPEPRFVIVYRCRDRCEAMLLDTTVNEDAGSTPLERAVRPLPGAEASGDGFWGCLEVRGTRGTIIVKPAGEAADPPYPIDEIDLRTGKLTNLAPVGRDLGCPSFDASGNHGLFFRADMLYRWNLAEAEVIAPGYAEAAW